MRTRRTDPFHIALTTLRRRIGEGAYAPEHRFAAIELGPEFGLSPTPIREVLSRLAGEGLLEDRRGQGFFLPHLTARDVAQLYRLHLAHLQLALADAAAGSPGAPAGLAAPGSPQEAVAAGDQAFADWVAATGGRALREIFRRLQAQLGPVRRREPELIGDLVPEISALLAAKGSVAGPLMGRLRAFHARRVRLAPRLAELLERAHGDPEL